MIETKVVSQTPRETGSPSSGAPDRLAASGLVKSFRGRKVVKGVSLDVQAGEVVGLLGPNGAGKTTIFDMMVGLCQPDEGQIALSGSESPTCRCTDGPGEESATSPRIVGVSSTVGGTQYPCDSRNAGIFEK